MTQKRFRKLLMALGFTPKGIEYCIRHNKYNIRIDAFNHCKDNNHYDYQFKYELIKSMKGDI